MAFNHDSLLNLPTLKQHNSSIGRVYMVEDGSDKGLVYPSITRILGSKVNPGLVRWRERVGAKEAARVSAVATSIGGNCHKRSECYLNNEELPVSSSSVMELWAHLRPWFDKNITTVFAQEQNVYSRKLKVAGRVDLLALVGGRRAVVDIKTAAKEKLEAWVQDYFLQLTFYSLAAYELTGKPFKHLVLPVVNPNGLQVFESTPAAHFDELRERIDEFYRSYSYAANTVDIPATA